MRGHLVVVAGTGTGIGKSHVACSLLRAWGALRATGYKPVETGVSGSVGADALALRRASSFHVKPVPEHWTFRAPISPHLAARQEGRAINAQRIATEVAKLRSRVDVVVLELAGGLFSPIGAQLLNIDLVRRLASPTLLLVAPDRLGVLHDIAATTRAAEAAGVRISGIVLSAPHRPDASTGQNGPELRAVTRVPLIASLPQGTVHTLSRHPSIRAFIATQPIAPAPPGTGGLRVRPRARDRG